MKPIQDVVRAKLEGQPGQEDAVALWGRLWTAYEKGGTEEAATVLAALLESRPAGEAVVEFEGGKS